MRTTLAPLAVLTIAALATLSFQVLAEPQSETHTIAPARFTERNVELQEGDRVAWRISLQPPNATAAWNLHSHDPADRNKVINHEQGVINGTGSVEGLFTAPSTAVFSWQVTSAYRLPLNVTTTTDVNPTAAPAPVNSVPGPEVLPLAGAALAAVLLVRPRRPRAAPA